MGKIEANKQEKEQKLLDTAFTLFTTRGFVKTSISDIAERAGLAKGTFYLYFQDKYDIQEKLITRKSAQVFQHALACLGREKRESFSDDVIAFVDDILDQFQKNKTLLRFINKNLSWEIFHRALGDTSEDYLNVVRGFMDVRGEQIEDLELMLYTIIELVGSSCCSVILEEDPVSLEEFKPYLYCTIRGIIGQYRKR